MSGRRKKIKLTLGPRNPNADPDLFRGLVELGKHYDDVEVIASEAREAQGVSDEVLETRVATLVEQRLAEKPSAESPAPLASTEVIASRAARVKLAVTEWRKVAGGVAQKVVVEMIFKGALQKLSDLAGLF